jgi:hypothetical protein
LTHEGTTCQDPLDTDNREQERKQSNDKHRNIYTTGI